MLGVFSDWSYQQGEVALADGDRILLLTDGVTEARDTKEYEFGEARSMKLLAEHRGLNAADLQATVVRRSPSSAAAIFTTTPR